VFRRYVGNQQHTQFIERETGRKKYALLLSSWSPGYRRMKMTRTREAAEHLLSALYFAGGGTGGQPRQLDLDLDLD
jgi:hypothetical protein